MSKILERKVEYIPQDQTTFEATLKEVGLDKDLAHHKSELDREIASGAGREVTEVVRKVTGRAPQSFMNFVSERKDSWIQS